jgi:GTPase SAR1 family protein
MAKALFILGLPGSGKSALARFIQNYVQDNYSTTTGKTKWLARRYNDYGFLLQMFEQEMGDPLIVKKRFKPAKPGGFDVLNYEVLDEALEQLISFITCETKFATNQLSIIEFSRNNYQHAFKLVDPEILRNSNFLYLDTPVNVCKDRIQYRISHPASPEDDYPVSDYIFGDYYHGDDVQQISEFLIDTYGVDRNQVWLFHNDIPLKDACKELESYLLHMLDTASQRPESRVAKANPDNPTSRKNTEPLVGSIPDLRLSEQAGIEVETSDSEEIFVSLGFAKDAIAKVV